ncbi:MAG: efflux RND transporter permease subunit [Betaproteobacteria bacterium]|nr:efflux RND transporter permease subunit [Betaproteobacteria bacterium]
MLAALVRFAIRNPGAILALAIAVLVYGVYSARSARLDVFPEFSPPQVVIQTEAPGFSAELVETLVSRPIEAVLNGTVGVATLRSQSIPGLSVVTLIFDDSSDVYRNRQLVGEKLAILANRLPAGVASPNITPLTSSASSTLGIGLTAKDRDLMDVYDLAQWVVRPHLLSAQGVADVNVFGGKVRQWQVQFEPDALIRYGVSVPELVEAVRRSSALRPGGTVESSNQRIIVTTEGQLLQAADMAQAVLTLRNGQVVRLADVARVVEAPAPSISAATINGTPGVFLMVQGQLGANTYATTQAVEVRLAQLAPLLASEGLTVHSNLFRPANFIETALGNVGRDILIGSALVVAVLFLFLFNARTALVSATAIPLSLLASVIVLVEQGVSLNIMVLGGLVIALGEVVDDAIIDVENIFRRLRENRASSAPRSDWQVVLDASLEVRSSVIYATFIVVTVFFPLLTLSGVAGRLFEPLGLAYIYALLASLLVALTVTPALCFLLLARGIPLRSEDPPVIGWLRVRYVGWLRGIERSARPVVLLTLGAVLLGLASIPLFRVEFVPELREGHYIVHMTAIPGTSEAESLRIGRKVTDAIGSVPGVQSVTQWVGRAQNGADTFGMHYSEIEVEIGPLPAEAQARVLDGIRQRLTTVPGKPDLAPFPGVSFGVNTFLAERIEETVSGYAAEFVVEVFGNDLDLLDRDASAIAKVLQGIEGARDITIQSPPGTPQMVFQLDPARLSERGLQMVDVLDLLRTFYGGIEVGQVVERGRTIPLVAIAGLEHRQALERAGQLRFQSPDGSLFRLADVADVRQANGRSKILHSGGKRVQTVTCNIVGRDVPGFVREVQETVAREVRLGNGNYVAVGGDAAAAAKARNELLAHTVLATVGVLLLLYLALGNGRNLLITLLNLPFALIGGVLAVVLSGGWLSIGSLVGFVTLFGITLRNSIMLVSHYQHLVQVEGHAWSVETALRGASERLPSILMTAIVTALGLMPLVIGSGEPGREIEGPMASIIVGGLVTSTILNLLILPTVLLHYGRFVRRTEA